MQDNHQPDHHRTATCPQPCTAAQPTNRASRRGNLTRCSNPDINVRRQNGGRRRA